MQIKRYEVENIQEAIKQIKVDMGPDAMIISTKRVRRTGGKYGLLGKSVLEVVAAIDGLPEALRDNPHPPEGATVVVRGQKLDTRIHDDLEDIRQVINKAGAEVKTGGGSAGVTPDNMNLFQKDLAEIKGIIYSMAAQSRINRLSSGSGALFRAFSHLRDAEVAESLALDLVERYVAATPDASSLDEKTVASGIRDLLIDDLLDCENSTIGSADRNSARVVALIGPTGVGKTTTIAKLAAKSVLKDKGKVGLITIDTYRIAAVEQLKVYAKIIGVPVEVVQTPAELTRALKKFGSMDRVYIDTIGQSQKDREQMEELKGFFNHRDDVKIHLVLSATTKNKDLLNIIENFGQVPFEAIIFSKTDESSDFGTLYNGLLWTRRPLSYITTGQNVPEDIEAGRYDRVADLILGGWIAP